MSFTVMGKWCVCVCVCVKFGMHLGYPAGAVEYTQEEAGARRVHLRAVGI